MSEYLGYYGVSTVDNLYVSVLWDAGVVGLVLLGIAAVASFVVMFDRRFDSVGRICAAGVVMLLASGIFFDTFYIYSVAVVAGLLMGGVMTATRHVVPEMDPAVVT
ncbi:hypothetical protein CBP52_16475 [Cellulomonas sp. PSBB021]|nr:hypothetical protein CBP52_16475 [Cellulomonas sp. PSBB021]